jgi:hypothetical protein
MANLLEARLAGDLAVPGYEGDFCWAARDFWQTIIGGYFEYPAVRVPSTSYPRLTCAVVKTPKIKSLAGIPSIVAMAGGPSYILSQGSRN